MRKDNDRRRASMSAMKRERHTTPTNTRKRAQRCGRCKQNEERRSLQRACARSFAYAAMTRLKKWRETAIRAATCKRSRCGGDTAAVARPRAHYKGEETRERERARAVALSLRRQHIEVWQNSCSRSLVCSLAYCHRQSQTASKNDLLSYRQKPQPFLNLRYSTFTRARACARPLPSARVLERRIARSRQHRALIDRLIATPAVGRLDAQRSSNAPSHEGQTPFVAHRRVRRPQKRQLQRQRRRRSLTMCARALAHTFVIRRTSEKARARVRLHSRCM